MSIAATLAGAYRIGRWAGGPAAGVLCLLIAFPVRIGLAGEALYRVAFSHSHLASALTIWAIVWFLEGRRLLPLLVLSVGAYNHLLYSLYALIPMVLVVLFGRHRRFAAREVPPHWRTAALAAAALLVAGWLGPRAYRFHQARWESGSWRAVQDWVRSHTPRSAVILTPPREAGFRVFSERTIVGEWKDGTQQYFDDAFVREWGARMEALGEDYSPLTEEQLVELAGRYGATYIVMPRRPRKALPEAYTTRPGWCTGRRLRSQRRVARR